MKALLEAAARVRTHVETFALNARTAQAMRSLVEFAIAANPPVYGAPEPTQRSPHTLYMHPNGRCCITLEPADLRTPYHEWRRVYDSWALYDRHCWYAHAFAAASGPIAPGEPAPRHHSSRPPAALHPSGPPKVEVMPLEEQVRQLLLVDKDRGKFNGTLDNAEICLSEAGFNLNDPEVVNALWLVVRGIRRDTSTPRPLSWPAPDAAGETHKFEDAAAALLADSPITHAGK